MKRRRLLAGLTVAAAVQLLAAVPAFAATYVEQIVAQLRAQGFVQIEVETTWLGRARIEAVRGDVNREIVLNPNTGEVLRDLWLSTSGTVNRTVTIGDDRDDDQQGDDGGDNSGPGNGGDGDDPDDDAEDDNDEGEDNDDDDNDDGDDSED